MAGRRQIGRTDFPPVAVEGTFPGARRDMADALKRFAVRIGLTPASVVARITVGPIDPAIHGCFEYRGRFLTVDGTHPHRAEVAAHELGHALDAAILRALIANAERAFPPDFPRIGIKPDFDVPRRFASTDAMGLRDYENDGVKKQLRGLQTLSKSYAVNFVFERWIDGRDDLRALDFPGAPEHGHYLKSPEEGFAELVRRYLFPRIRNGRKVPPCRFEAEHLDEFRRETLPFVKSELEKCSFTIVEQIER